MLESVISLQLRGKNAAQGILQLEVLQYGAKPVTPDFVVEVLDHLKDILLCQRVISFVILERL